MGRKKKNDVREREEKELEELHIRFTQLYISVRFPEDVRVPEHKESAIRGGMGNFLLAANCVQDRNCDGCSFREDCIVQRVMYAPYRIRPPYVTTESLGFVLFCPDRRTDIPAGDGFTFELTLFGTPILYFSAILNALFALGQHGLGKYKARCVISDIRNRRGEPILQGADIHMENYRTELLEDYAMERIRGWENRPVRLQFLSPLSVKFHGRPVTAFHGETAQGVVNAISRRVHMLMLYEGLDVPEPFFEPEESFVYLGGRSAREQVERYSSVSGGKMSLWGVKGWLDLEVRDRELLKLLAAGELARAGKNTRFGFGVYRMEGG